MCTHIVLYAYVCVDHKLIMMKCVPKWFKNELLCLVLSIFAASQNFSCVFFFVCFVFILLQFFFILFHLLLPIHFHRFRHHNILLFPSCYILGVEQRKAHASPHIYNIHTYILFFVLPFVMAVEKLSKFFEMFGRVLFWFCFLQKIFHLLNEKGIEKIKSKIFINFPKRNMNAR